MNAHRRDYGIDDRPLSPDRLAAIWRQLPERERFRFILALTEDLADQVINLTYEKPAQSGG